MAGDVTGSGGAWITLAGAGGLEAPVQRAGLPPPLPGLCVSVSARSNSYIGPNNIKQFEPWLAMAKNLSEAAIQTQSAAKMVDYRKTDTRALAMYGCILNHLVYHRTAYVLCTGKSDGMSATSLILNANECFNLANNIEVQQYGQVWFNTHETAAYSLITLGDDSSKETGRQIIRDIFNGKTPGANFEKPSKEWLDRLLCDYFPKAKDGTIQDRYGLGNIPRPR